MASDEPPKPGGLFGRFLSRGKAREEERDEAPDDLVDSAEAFKSLRVADVMTPRADIVAIELSATFKELLAEFVEAEHSRMPVYRETLDDPVGVVHVKDVFKLVAGEGRTPGPEAVILPELRRELLYVPPSMPASALLAKMQTSRLHMALVIDEFGGADGLVTLEDLLEAVVGEIDDEHDETARVQIMVRGPGIFEADGRAPLEDLHEALGEDLTPPDLEEEIDTVGGLVGALAGRVPQRGEIILHPAGFEFEVVEADPRRVSRVRVRDKRPSPDENES
jgi:CBS domain containing-hemolysin-like protein